MKFFKRAPRRQAKTSFILLDWSVRESPHLIHYLRQQTVAPEDIEVIYIEFYGREFEALHRYEDRVDIWVALEMPKTVYYAKHLMYNAGIILASGDIVVICDPDALVNETFVEHIIRMFEDNPNIVLHIDQFRNLRRDFYPFNFPALNEVAGEGCINDAGGVTTGLCDHEDPIHTRNYGSCFCAKRADVVAIGGADMHIDYVGHICGAYDLSFRLHNFGRRIVWSEDTFMYHTWHPGTDGVDNYLGPHDGRNFSTAAMEFLATGDVVPLRENEGMALLRANPAHASENALDKLIETFYLDHWQMPELIRRASQLRRGEEYRTFLGVADGFLEISDRGRIRSMPLGVPASVLSETTSEPALTAVAAVFRCLDVALQLIMSYVPKRAKRVRAPRWVQRWLVVPLLVLGLPLLLVVAGDFHQRVRLVMHEFRDLTNPLRSLALVLRRLVDRPPPRHALRVVHDRAIVLAGLRFMWLLKLVPDFEPIKVIGGESLRQAVINGSEEQITLVPSGLYVRYHLDVPAVPNLRNVVVV